MRLADLQDDLAAWDSGTRPHLEDMPTVSRVARRVADLFDECPDCGGTGCVWDEMAGKVGMWAGCRRCGGTGAVARAEDWPDYPHTPIGMGLFRYLFGGEV